MIADRLMPLLIKVVTALARSVAPGMSPRTCSVTGPVGVQVNWVCSASLLSI